MATGDGAGGQTTVGVQIKFYRGVKAIANFLEMHPDTVRKLIRQGKIPAKKDTSGRWVLVNLDYYQSLQG
jgi:excisionase family DNA binding protein